MIFGPLAQLVRATGSYPVGPGVESPKVHFAILITHGPVAQLVRAPPCHGGGHGFESRLGRFGILAQLGEHLPYKQRVTGSSPVGPKFRRGGTGRRAGLKILL